MMPEPIKMIVYRGDRAACWYYRIHAPLGHVAKNHQDEYSITVSGMIDKRQLGEYPLVLLQRQYMPEVLGPIIDAKKLGAKLIYEIDDDLFNIPKWNSAYPILGKKSVREGVKRFLSVVDALFVTSEHLAKVYEPYCKKVYVLPNSVDYEFFYPSPRNSAKPVVCWQGSMTHEKDLKIMGDGIFDLAQDDRIQLKMWCGFKQGTQEPIFDVPGAHTIQLVPFEAFYPMFSQMDADVGLAPIAAIPFNRGKSNLKFLEYTAQGAVTVASSFGPYKDTIVDGETGVLVSDNREWYDATMWLIEEPEERARILANARTFVKENYDISKNYKLWKTALDEVLEGK